MTAGNDGTPEDDDPFAYLYRSEGGEQPGQAAGQPGVPRTSYHQVQRVGERRSPAQSGYGYPPQQPGPGGQQAQGGYGYPPAQPGAAPQQGGYGYPPQQPAQAPYGYEPGRQQYAGQYSGPTQALPGQSGAPGGPQQPGGGRRGSQGGGSGPGGANRRGLLIGAVAVVAVVAVAIAFAMTNGSGGKDKTADGQTSKPSAASSAPSTSASPSPSGTPFASQKTDAATVTLAGGAQPSTEHPGANAAGGTYVDHMSTQGASATWTVTVPKDGKYTFFISYGNAGQDATLTLGVNGKQRDDAVNLRNYGGATDWAKAWNMSTYSWVDLKKGANTLQLSCTPANSNCGVNLDQFWLKQGWVKQ
jgi:hypothetical protein